VLTGLDPQRSGAGLYELAKASQEFIWPMEDARKVGHCGVKIGAHHDAFLFVRVGARADGHRRCGRAAIDRNVWHPGRGCRGNRRGVSQ
jgi:hypothetical protein